MSADLSTLHFHASSDSTDKAYSAIRAHLDLEGPGRIVDVGCGTGDLLRRLARSHRQLTCIGIDFSEPNIRLAKESAADIGRMTWQVADYLRCPLEPADLIFSNSVFQLIPAPPESILAKLHADLRLGGVLLFIMPYRSFVNQAIVLARRLLRLVRCRFVDWLILRAAQLAYPGWTQAMLKERLEYVYLVPHGLYDKRWQRAAEGLGLERVATSEWHRPSIAKLRHRLYVYRRAR